MIIEHFMKINRIATAFRYDTHTTALNGLFDLLYPTWILSYNDDVIKWKHFPRHWPFVRVTGEFPAQRPVRRSFNIFFDLRLNEQLSKQSWGWWLETPSRSLWRHCNDMKYTSQNVCMELFCPLYIFKIIWSKDYWFKWKPSISMKFCQHHC